MSRLCYVETAGFGEGNREGRGNVMFVGKRRNRKVVCDNLRKVRHRDKKTALQSLRRLQNLASTPANEGRVLPVRVYKCEHCKGWHLTSEKLRRAVPAPTVPVASVVVKSFSVPTPATMPRPKVKL
jgi:predicted Zn-ribbon and HTH transcriptional regulator